MGWWNQNQRGDSFEVEEDLEMYWGDGPADTLDNALLDIAEQFMDTWNRYPTLGELRAGLEFSIVKGEDSDEYPAVLE